MFCVGIYALIKAATPSCDGMAEVLAIWGEKLTNYPPPEDQRPPLLNEVWKSILATTEVRIQHNPSRCIVLLFDVIYLWFG